MRSSFLQRTASGQTGNGVSSTLDLSGQKPEKYTGLPPVTEPPANSDDREEKPLETGPGGHNFGEVSVFPPTRLRLQPKLKINPPGDRYEREADRLAEQIFRQEETEVKEDIGRGGAGAGRINGLEAPSPVAAAIRSLLVGGQPLPPNVRAFFEPRLDYDLRRVRVHTEVGASNAARAIQAKAFTVGSHLFFGAGEYAPEQAPGRRLLAHELVHVVQQGGIGAGAGGNGRSAPGTQAQRPPAQANAGDLAVQRREDTGTADLPIPPLRRFEDILADFHQHRLLGRDAEAADLIPDLIAHMNLEEARSHAVELAFWLMDRGDWTQAQAALSRLEDAWWIQYVTTGIPVNIFMIPDTPRRLYERARGEAMAGRHTQAEHLLGMAYLFTQFLLHDATQRREAELQSLNERVSDWSQEARDQLPGITAIPRIITYSGLESIYTLFRDILGLYPRLEREAIAAGDQERARQYSGLGLLVRMELRDRYTLSGVRALTMETEAATTSLGEAGYRIIGRDITTTETVTPLPGTRTPAELGAFPTYGATTATLMESIAGQEEYLTELFTYPEIRSEFRNNLPDMNRQGDRLRVWRTMYRVYQRDHMFPLSALMSLIQSYLQRFTFHSEYNIRDFGVSYLSRDFPVDLAGRAVRDCGVYALMTAYEVYRTARGASPRLNLAFRLYAMPEHVILVITNRDEDNFYIVNNNQITGPRTGEEIAAVATAYSQIFGRRFGVAPGVAVNLGSTGMGESAFRSQAWQRYQVGAATGLRPELPPGAGPDVTVGEATHHTYQRYYQDLENFDRGARGLAAALDALRRETEPLPDERARAILNSRLPALTTAGRALTMIFAQRGPQADVIVDERRARAVLGRNYAQRLPQIVGSRSIFVFSESANHPLARLARALLRFEHLGGTLPAEAQTLIQALRLIREFNDDIDAYDRAGRPPTF